MPEICSFDNTWTDRLPDHIRYAATLGLRVAEPDRHRGEPGAVVVGLGPSIMRPDVLSRVRALAQDGWTVFGIKEAISYLTDRGIPVRYSVNIDPSLADVDRMPIVDGVTYMVAPSCNPALFDRLIGAGARVELFLSACGAVDYQMDPGFVLPLGDGTPGASDQRAVVLGQFELMTNDPGGYPFCPICTGTVNEHLMYERLLGVANPQTIGNGYTAGNRACRLALWWGFPRVVAAGLDFGCREGADYYAPITTAAPADTIFFDVSTMVDGRPWITRLDLLGSAAELAKLIRQGKVEVLGDSLVAGLAALPAEFVEQHVIMAAPAAPAPATPGPGAR